MQKKKTNHAQNVGALNLAFSVRVAVINLDNFCLSA